MLIPNNIPNWYNLIQKAEEYDMKFTINLDMFSGTQTGHIQYKEHNYAFRLEVFPQNMLLSLKEFNQEIFENMSKIMGIAYRILYETQTEYTIHGEWYYECAEEDVINEMIKLVKCENIKVIDLNQLNLY